MTSKSKKWVIAIVVLLLALGLWWALAPKTPMQVVEAKPLAEPAPAPVVAAAPAPEPIAPAPVPVEPEPVKVEPAPEPVKAEPAPVKIEAPAPEPAPAPTPEPARAPAPEPEPSAPAEVTTPPPAPLVLEKIEPKKNKISLSYRLGLNITADFKKLGGFGNPNNPGPDTGSVEDRTYDDGYNLVDISGNAGGQTWNWGYTDPGSIQGNNMVLHSTSSPSTGVSKDNDDGVNNGVELSYQYEIQRGEKNDWRWGAEAAFGFTWLSIDDTRVVHNEVNEITDTFGVPGGVFVIPQAPYYGTFQGPGPLLSSDLGAGDRVRTVLTRATTITGHRELDANVYLIRLGPYFEYSLNKDFSLFANAGLNLVIGDMDFTYTETVEFQGNIRATRRDSGSNTDFLVGAYVGAGISYAIDENWGVFTGAQLQTAGRSVTKEGGKEAVLDMSKAIVVNIGVSYSF